MSVSQVLSFNEYQRLYEESIKDPQRFWSKVAEQLFWKCGPKNVLECNFDVRKGPISIKFMEGALTNVCYNVLDRVIERGQGDHIAYHWEGNDGKAKRRITYSELRREVCKFANGLKGLGIKKGDRIAIYMPVSIECVVAMLSCARIGAVHSVIFAGFSAEALAHRIIDSRCVLLICADQCYRANKLIHLKKTADSALDICRKSGYQNISIIVEKHSNTGPKGTVDDNDGSYAWNDQVNFWWQNIIKNQSDVCQPEWVDAVDPLFILYTSGSTGKPKGIVQTCGGFLVYSYFQFKTIWGLREGDVFLSTSDMGWITAHLHTVYGGLANGITSVLMEGTPTFPTPDRLWEIIDRLEVNVLLTVPTVLRISKKLGDHYVKAYKRSSLRVVSVGGEPTNPELWHWCRNVVGNGQCSIVDIYAQTENGGPMITNIAGCIPMKPGSPALPFFGVLPAVLDDKGIEIIGEGEGHLVYKMPWPALAPTIDGNHALFEWTYFQKFPGYYWTGDGVRRDADGYYWITGRIDDTLNVCGHLLSSIEIEMAVIEHRSVAEAAVVSAPHALKGEVPIVFVVLNNGFVMSSELELEIKNKVREKIGAHSHPNAVLEVSALPKTKTGKIMRRILYKIIRNDWDFGDTSTLEEEGVLNELKAIQTKFSINC